MTRPSLSRRQFLGLATALGLAAATGCTGSDDDGDDESAPLRVLNWAEYIDVDGAEPGTVARFEQATGIPVHYVEEYDGNEDAFERLFEPTLGRGRPTGFDVVVPTYWAVDRMLARGWLEPVPLELVPNHVNIEPGLLGMPWDRGARFHMPWQVGITGIAYDPRLTGRELRSVADLFDPALKGRVSMVSEMRETVGLVMLTQGADPSRVTEASAERALERLAALISDGQVTRFTANEFVDLLGTGEIAACLAWSGDIVQLQRERPDLRFVIPVEGGIRWFDSMVIPRDARRPAAAARWMDFAYDPANAARITMGVQYISPVLGVREELERLGGEAARLADDPILFPDDETRRRLFFWAGLDAEAEDAVQRRFSEITGT